MKERTSNPSSKIHNEEKVDLSRRQFLGKSSSYSAAAAVGVGVAASSYSPPANAFFITAAKIYGELIGLACRIPTISAYEYASDFIADTWAKMSTGTQAEMMQGYEGLVELGAVIDREKVGRQAEPAPGLCKFQESGFTQQKYQYRDQAIINKFCTSPPEAHNNIKRKNGYLNVDLLIDKNSHVRNMTGEERNEIMTDFRALGSHLAKRSDYTGQSFTSYNDASDEMRQMMAYQGLNVVTAMLAGDERYASELQATNSFGSADWRQSLIDAGGETGLYAEASRQLGQLCHNEHQLLLSEERLMIMEAISAIQTLSLIQERKKGEIKRA